MEKTLIIIKADAFTKRLVGKVISKLEDSGLRILGAKMIWFDKALAREFYIEHKSKDFYYPLINFITSNPVMVMVAGGENAVTGSRKIIGATDPARAREGTIRRMWAQDGRHNIVHGSDSPVSAKREINLLFPGEEGIYEWEDKEYRL
ncbi:MAG: nucleoside-diphosphate kinase [Elusimicrobia bacterium]|nr:nucleoside-diphosphate kinase [Elusimicrobiota bacterium]